jgi:hypothetical protein
MSDKRQDWFIAERARTLALLHLTRRKDLVITEAGRDVGLEFVVLITKEEGEASLRQFGVFLRGTKSAATEAHLNKLLHPTMAEIVRAGQFPYPVCLFYFTVDDDQGYYTWVAEPIVREEFPVLVMHSEPHCRKLDRSALDEIVDTVDRWYEVFFRRIAVKAS